MIELMVVLGIIAIGFNVAVPSISAMVDRNRAATNVNEFLLTINMARSEALKTGGIVSIQAMDPSDSDNEFGAGWCIVEGNPGNCDGSVVRSFPALTGDTTLDSSEDESSIQFNYLGELEGGVAQNIDLCSRETERRIFIALIGRSKSHRPDDLVVAKQPSCG